MQMQRVQKIKFCLNGRLFLTKRVDKSLSLVESDNVMLWKNLLHRNVCNATSTSNTRADSDTLNKQLVTSLESDVLTVHGKKKQTLNKLQWAPLI